MQYRRGPGPGPGGPGRGSTILDNLLTVGVSIDLSPLWLALVFGVGDIAAAAGRAAHRLEARNADVDNEVYRAWHEMTRLLDVPSPESSTPGEFADAAVDLGLERRHVDELTRLFEEVRYGQKDPNEREAQALAVFRDIEAAYAGQTDGSPETR